MAALGRRIAVSEGDLESWPNMQKAISAPMATMNIPNLIFTPSAVYEQGMCQAQIPLKGFRPGIRITLTPRSGGSSFKMST